MHGLALTSLRAAEHGLKMTGWLCALERRLTIPGILERRRRTTWKPAEEWLHISGHTIPVCDTPMNRHGTPLQRACHEFVAEKCGLTQDFEATS